MVLNYEFPPLGGGASPFSFDLAMRLSSVNGMYIDVVTMQYKQLPAIERIGKNLTIHRVDCIRRKKSTCSPFEQMTYLHSARRKCNALIAKHRYDLIHAHFFVPTGLLALYLHKKYHLPYIITTHGSDVPGFNPDRFRLLHKFTPPLLKRICGSTTHIIAPSDYLAKLVTKNIDESLHEKISVIPNGIDPSKFKPTKKQNRILAVGRLLKRKGFQKIILAVSNKDIGFEIDICGDGPMRSELERLAVKSKTKINFYGWLDNNSDEMKRLYARAKIYISASSEESFGMTLIEAVSAGCHPIVSDIPAHRAIIPNNENLFDLSIPESLRERILEAVGNETPVSHLSITKFSMSSVGDEYLKIYRSTT
jgi:glycosyltransferase involved in cell wall biosynthesis